MIMLDSITVWSGHVSTPRRQLPALPFYSVLGSKPAIAGADQTQNI